MPKRGPKCKLGYHCVFNLILWVLYTGMQWKCLPVPKDIHSNPAIHYTTVSKVFAKWADDGSLWQAFMASVTHLSTEKQLDVRVLHGDGTNTVAKKGGDLIRRAVRGPRSAAGARIRRAVRRPRSVGGVTTRRAATVPPSVEGWATRPVATLPPSAGGATLSKRLSSAGRRAQKRMRSWWATSALRSLSCEASLTGWLAASSKTTRGWGSHA
jgi:transposase